MALPLGDSSCKVCAASEVYMVFGTASRMVRATDALEIHIDVRG
jgi:hypothetical protein